VLQPQSVSIVPGISAGNANKNFTCNNANVATGAILCLLFGVNANTIPDGQIGIINAVLQPGVLPGTTTRISLTGTATPSVLLGIDLRGLGPIPSFNTVVQAFGPGMQSYLIGVPLDAKGPIPIAIAPGSSGVITVTP
jgi:hypothetical protein